MSLPPLPMQQMIPLVTGGGSGIGLALVKEFIKRGAPKVLITGRGARGTAAISRRYH